MEKNMPIKKYSYRQLSVSVFENTFERDGETKTMKTYSLQKSYKDKEDNWHTSNNLTQADLAEAVILFQKVAEEENVRVWKNDSN